MEHDKAVVKYIERHSSYHSLLILDTNSIQGRRKPSFYFDNRWVQRSGIEDIVKSEWDTKSEGSTLLKVDAKIKICRLELFQWI